MPIERPVDGPAEHDAELPTATLNLPAQEPPTEHLTLTVPATPIDLLDRPVLDPATETLTLRPGPDKVPVELRVHGVTGTPAEDMLDRHIIGRVAGDGDAGFFRPREEYGATLGPGGARLEAYRWGNLTAGAAARAFWLLLLPFTLANVAIWLRPPGTRGLGRILVRGITRVFALSLTATLVLTATGISVDLVAWQCATAENNQRCVESRPWLRYALTGFFEPTGRRLALAAIVPIALVAVLWFLAQRTWARYESFDRPEVNPEGDGLATPSVWDGRGQVGRLRSLHVAAGFATIDAVLLYVLLRHDATVDAYAGVNLHGGRPDALLAFGRGLALVVALVVALSLLLLFWPRMVDRASTSPTASAVAQVLRWVSLAATGLTLAYALLPRAPWPTTGSLPGFADTVTALFAAQAGLLGLLVLVIVFLRHRAKGALFAGFGTPVVASLGLGFAAALAAGASYRVADFLDRGTVPSPADFNAHASTLRVQPPVSYEWAAFGFVVLVLVALLAMLWIKLVTMPLLRRKAHRDTDADYLGGRARDPVRAAAIDTKIATARLTDHVSRTFGVAWLALAGGAIVATALALRHVGPVELVRSGSRPAVALHVLTNLGTYLISLTVLALVLLGVQTYRNERVRKTVGVIWDLGTFWPRASHPLAPPCYAERVVPELVHRSTWLAKEQGGLVLSGHSQGSVLAAAVVLQLPAAARERTALLTYGSPLCRLYERAFPCYLGPAAMREIGAAVTGSDGMPRWINLWRRTDPIGGAVGIGDRRLIDPVGFNPPPGDRVAPQVSGHSGYQVTPEFAQAVTDLMAHLPVRAPVVSSS
ncbi:MAG: hypothetical protein ACM30G_14520 [Micromonosporaceae bacterium]